MLVCCFHKMMSNEQHGLYYLGSIRPYTGSAADLSSDDTTHRLTIHHYWSERKLTLLITDYNCWGICNATHDGEVLRKPGVHEQHSPKLDLVSFMLPGGDLLIALIGLNNIYTTLMLLVTPSRPRRLSHYSLALSLSRKRPFSMRTCNTVSSNRFIVTG